MTELQNIIAQGEGYFTEFKRNINSDLKKELVAFANASGGNIFLGIAEKSSEKIISKELTGSQLDLLNLISDNPGIRTNMISELLSRSVNTLEKQIKILISKELIERKGGKKTGGYFIKNNNNTDIKETIVAD